MAYGSYVIQHDLDFSVERGEIFVIMGGSGSGKSTLLNHMVGLKAPARGDVVYDGESFWGATAEAQEGLRRRLGVSFQGGALWSSMTLAENVGLPLQTFTRLPARQIRDIVSLKLALVGLAGYEEFYPSEISGGMMKRAGVARAMALDPETRTMIACGPPKKLRDESPNPTVRTFLRRGEANGAAGGTTS